MSGQELISRLENAKVYGKVIVFISHELYTLLCCLELLFNHGLNY